MICEKCGKEHNGSFGSGRFCSRGCANSKVQTKEMNEARRKLLLKPKNDRHCEKCGGKISKNNKSGICINCKPPAKTRAEKISIFRRKRKICLVEYKGGKCEICDYNKCYGSLSFHHINPDEKEFAISRKGFAESLERAKKEVDKCILVCMNCHGEIHAGVTIIPDNSAGRVSDCKKLQRLQETVE